MEPDIQAVDRGERTTLMEPLLLGSTSPHRHRLTDLALDLAQKSAGFKRSIPPALLPSLASLVRSMNCYYSNLIEGHNTHPVDIERALQKDFSADPHKRDLQREAAAHIAVQHWIDTGALSAQQATSQEGIREIHRRFCELLPSARHPSTNKHTAGQLRTRDVRVGDHIPISPGALPRFLARFSQVYSQTSKTESILAAAAVHHRLLWIHPFLDGNGRVARLVSHAQLLQLLDTGAVWSLARGLAQNVQEYKRRLANCDLPSHNKTGHLSEEALAEFTAFFLTTCLDQVAFMDSLLQPARLRTRIQVWAEEETRLGNLPAKSAALLDALLYRGELPRGEAENILGTGERQARRIVSALLEKGVLTSASHRAPLRLAFPATLAGRWLPGLFPDLPA